eukprot:1180427-Prorocentrum_minimum.AAC.4
MTRPIPPLRTVRLDSRSVVGAEAMRIYPRFLNPIGGFPHPHAELRPLQLRASTWRSLGWQKDELAERSAEIGEGSNEEAAANGELVECAHSCPCPISPNSPPVPLRMVESKRNRNGRRHQLAT